MPVPPVHLMEDRDEHRWNILEKILRFRAIEQRGVLAQFVRDLVDDEVATVRERLIRFRQQGALLFDFENAERDSGKNVVAVRDAPALQLLRQARGIPVDDVDARVIRELAPEIPGKGGIQLEEEQLGTRRHPAGNLSRVDAFAGAIFRDYARFAKIHLAGHPLHEGLRARYDRRDLKRAL